MTGKQLAQMIGISETQLSLFAPQGPRDPFLHPRKDVRRPGMRPGRASGYEYKVSEPCTAEEAEE
jgi:hypothetical protein